MKRGELLAVAMDDEWYLHYGFDRDPFDESGVQGLFYPGGARQETVEQLQHLARYSDCSLLVTGVPGAGKTATRRHFVAQCAPDTRCCVLEAALLEGPEPWLRRILEGFGLRAAPQGGLDTGLRELAEHCAARHAASTGCWLVIDDAHHLHQDVVQFLPRLLQATGRHLRVVLFAEPSWREQLQAVMPPGVPLHAIELQPFERGETHAYIHYRLNTAGLDGEPPFSPEELEQIHKRSGGLPGQINAQARQVLVEALGVVQQPLTSLPLWHFGVIAATLAALLLLYAWSAMDPDPEPRPVPIPGLASIEELQPAEELAAAPETLPEAGAGAGVTLPAESLPPVIEPSEDPMPGEAEPATADAEPAYAAPGRAPEQALAAAPEAPVPAPAPAPAPKPAPAAQPATVPDKPAEAKDAAATEFVYRAGGRAGGPASADEQFLLGLDPGRYVLQIMGSDDLARVKSFAGRAGVSLRMYRKLNNGREWYSLVYGNYADRASAERAAKNLPRGLSGSRPWTRRVDAIQKEIRSARAL